MKIIITGEAEVTLNNDTTAELVLDWKPEKNIVNYIKSNQWKK